MTRILHDSEAAPREGEETAINQWPLRVALVLLFVLGGLVLPALLAVWAARQRKAGWPTALWALEIAVLYVFFSSLLGDGYVEIHRHAVLCYSLGCLSLTALFGAAMHHVVPAPSANQPSGFVP